MEAAGRRPCPRASIAATCGVVGVVNHEDQNPGKCLNGWQKDSPDAGSRPHLDAYRIFLGDRDFSLKESSHEVVENPL